MLSESAELVDAYIQKKAERLALQREVDKLDADEKKLKALIIEALQKNNAQAVGGHLATATLVIKDKPVARDWNQVYAYIQENDAWDLLQKRFTETAVRLRWEDGIAIPGVEKFPVADISISTR
jgi:hypothetical protein